MKKKLTKIIAMCALAGLMACVMTGCGKTEIDVMDGLTLEFNGVDGQGTARIADEYFWEDAALRPRASMGIRRTCRCWAG